MVVSGGLLTSAGMMTLDAASASDISITASTSMSSSSSLAMDGSSFQTYQVMPDASEALNPQLQELKVRAKKRNSDHGDKKY
jgi:hypothetical protein